MKPTLQHDPMMKRVLRSSYRIAQAARVATASRDAATEPRVFYGGARSGDEGGPLVKVQRLRRFFPEHRHRFNLLYILSNAPYLPGFALRALKAKHIPIVHNQNGVFYPAWFDGDWRAQNRRMAISYKLADHVFFQSDFCRRAAEEFLGPCSGHWEILHNAVDTDHFRPTPATRRSDRQGFIVLVTGKLGQHLFYRVESTLRGVAHARSQGLDAKLRIAGIVDAETVAQTEALASLLGMDGALEFAGPYSQADAPCVYQQADVYVTTKHNDPCPNAVIEAMACGLPVIYSNTGGVPELVGADAGVALTCAEDWERVHVPETADIGDAILTIAADDGDMAANARTRAASHFNLSAWIERHRQVFLGLLADRL